MMNKKILLFQLCLITYPCIKSIAQNLIRGPYIQQSTTNSIIIHWKTDDSCNSKVSVGVQAGIFNLDKIDSNFTTEHIIKIENLSANKKYFYNIGTTIQYFSPAQSNYFFYTNPIEGSKEKYRFWVTGDAGWGNNNQRMVRDGFLFFNSGKKLDGWIWLGDNAYYSGLQSEYQNNVFSNNTFENILKNLVVWAAPGNHDYGQNPNNQNPPWIEIFDFPTNGEAGGFPSGTEKYFSWNYGNIHFIQLDSYGSDISDSGDVAIWLEKDLKQNNQTWTIAYWHHPPYTKGNHDSDNLNGWDPELPQMRTNIVPILEKFGVDLILNGHSHAYERSFLINGHYGFSSSLTDSMKIDTSSGSFPFHCPYKKDTTAGRGNKGTIYAVVGTGGITSPVQFSWPHPIMYSYTNTELGSMLIEVNENKLQGSFVNLFAQKTDSFTIVKNMGSRKKILSCKDSTVTLYPTWHESASWEPLNITGDSISITLTHDSLIIAKDLTGCLVDTFELKIVPDSICHNVLGVSENNPTYSNLYVFPNPIFSPGELNVMINNINIESSEKIEIEILDLSSKTISTINNYSINHKILKFHVNEIDRGLYFVRVKSKNENYTTKIFFE